MINKAIVFSQDQFKQILLVLLLDEIRSL